MAGAGPLGAHGKNFQHLIFFTASDTKLFMLGFKLKTLQSLSIFGVCRLVYRTRLKETLSHMLTRNRLKRLHFT